MCENVPTENDESKLRRFSNAIEGVADPICVSINRRDAPDRSAGGYRLLLFLILLSIPGTFIQKIEPVPGNHGLDLLIYFDDGGFCILNGNGVTPQHCFYEIRDA